MRVAVTGGAGQLGTALIRRLAAERTIKRVVSIDRALPIVASSKLEAVTADVRDADLGKHFEGCDVVVHLAFLVMDHAPRSVIQSVNVDGSRNVFEAAAKAGAKQIVYASSIAQYGVVNGHPVPIVETTTRRMQPEFAYAATKFEVEELLDGFEREHPDVAVARFRPGILIGARINHALGGLLAFRRIPDVGAPPMPIVWDEDVATAMWLAIKTGARGAFNVCADDPIGADEIASAAGMKTFKTARRTLDSIRRVAPIVTKLGGPSVDPAWFNAADARMVIDSSKAKHELGWRPRYPTARDVAKRLGHVARGTVDPRIAFFMKILGALVRFGDELPGAEGFTARIHLELTGRGGADYTLSIANSRMRVGAGVPRSPTSVLSLSAQSFLDLLSGKLSPATVQITGKLRIEGEPVAAMTLGGIVTLFRRAAALPGAKGWPVRRFEAWMAR